MRDEEERLLPHGREEERLLPHGREEERILSAGIPRGEERRRVINAGSGEVLPVPGFSSSSLPGFSSFPLFSERRRFPFREVSVLYLSPGPSSKPRAWCVRACPSNLLLLSPYLT